MTWLIWSNYHRAWWAPGAVGYTSDVATAGRFMLEQALAHCSLRSVDPTDARSNPPELLVPSPEHVERLRRAPSVTGRASPRPSPMAIAEEVPLWNAIGAWASSGVEARMSAVVAVHRAIETYGLRIADEEALRWAARLAEEFPDAASSGCESGDPLDLDVTVARLRSEVDEWRAMEEQRTQELRRACDDIAALAALVREAIKRFWEPWARRFALTPRSRVPVAGRPKMQPIPGGWVERARAALARLDP